MHDWGFVFAGYAVTAGTLVAYRWRLATRARRAHRLVSALAGRASTRDPRR